MKKYLYVLIFLILIVLVSGSIGDKNQTKHYDNGEISFDYPGTWNEINDTSKSKVVSFSDPDGLNVTVIKQPMPSGYNFKDHFQLNSAAADKNFQLASQKNITVNGTDAYENVYNIQGENGSLQRKEIWFEKNNILYCIICTGQDESKKNYLGLNIKAPLDYLNGEETFDVMINSFKINDTGTESPDKSVRWAELLIPNIGADWWIRSDTVNGASSVYHVPKSFYPGEKGEMALMGHHTKYSAPFLYIDKLKPGDPVIIKDFITQKKYTYEVESNGDIRWGVEGTSINYQPSEEPKLFLITCYPPGFSQAAWIVHCKLVSVQPLN